jgi:hypothetical protein
VSAARSRRARTHRRAALALLALTLASAPDALAGAPPGVVVEKNLQGVVQWMYKDTLPMPQGLGALPPCGAVCTRLVQAQAALGPGDTEIVSELLELNYRTGVFSGFSNFPTQLSATPAYWLGADLGAWNPDVGVLPTHIGVERPQGDTSISVGRRNVGDLLATTSWSGGPFFGNDEIRAPTFGFTLGDSWNTGCNATTPTPRPGPQFIDLHAEQRCLHYDPETDLWSQDFAQYHQWFQPMRFDGAPAAVARPYSEAQYMVRTAANDPGIANVQLSASDELHNHSARYAALIPWIAAQLGDPTYLAHRFRPKLMFDKGEKWRPLNIDSFFSERNATNGQPVQCVGLSRSTCEPVLDATTLRGHASSADRIFQGDWATSLEPVGHDGYATNDTTCELHPDGADYALQDCDDGPAATIYYHALTRPVGYDYFDYWFFYRYNEFIPDSSNHEADWEEVTVAPSLDDPTTFDWIEFHEHNYSTTYGATGGSDYLRELLSCDGGGYSSCGSDDDNTARGQRVWAFVAAGTHASYPAECAELCRQPDLLGLPEGDHGGQAPWSANDAPGALVAFPSATGWSNPTQGNWTDWPGRWGAGGAPESPGNKPQYKCPSSGNAADPMACSARSRVAARAAAISRTGSRCRSWYGSAVVAAACSERELGAAVRRGRVGSGGALRIALPARRGRTGSGVGIAQAAGTTLRAGDRVVVRGRRSADTEVLVRARFGRRLRSWILRDLGTSGRRLTITVPRRSGEQPRVVRG